MWTQRLQGCQQDVEVWQRILSVRSLVLSPLEDINTWIKFASLCRKSGRFNLALKVLNTLLNVDVAKAVEGQEPFSNERPSVVYAVVKYLWGAGFYQDAFDRLNDLIHSQVFQSVDQVSISAFRQ